MRVESTFGGTAFYLRVEGVMHILAVVKGEQIWSFDGSRDTRYEKMEWHKRLRNF